jgi:hypothetical protein
MKEHEWLNFFGRKKINEEPEKRFKIGIKEKGVIFSVEKKTYLERNSTLTLQERSRVTKVKELSVNKEEDRELLKMHLSLLQDPQNSFHFVDVFKNENRKAIPIDFSEFLEQISDPGCHSLVGLNKNKEAIGFAVISDAQRGQNDNFIEKIVIVNDFQAIGKKRGFDAGSSLLDQVIKFGFKSKDRWNRNRIKLSAAIVLDVPGWERAKRLFESKGFVKKSVLEEQAEVYFGEYIDEKGVKVQAHFEEKKRTMRLELLKSDYLKVQK